MGPGFCITNKLPSNINAAGLCHGMTNLPSLSGTGGFSRDVGFTALGKSEMFSHSVGHF